MSASAADVDHQLTALIAAGREQRIFSAAAWAAGDRDGVLVRGHLGTRAWPEYAGEVDQEERPLDTGPLNGTELFDLASVTKPLVALVIFALIENGRLDLGDTVGQVLDEYAGSSFADRPIAELLLHTSGLPGRIPLFRRAGSRTAMLEALGQLPILTRPGSRVEYSSQGFILLGLIAERVSGDRLDALITDLVAKPADAATLQFQPSGIPCVATESCAWRGRIVQGQVHDENAAVLGGTAGHAGLFGSLDDLISIGRGLLANQTDPVFVAPSTLRVMTKPRTDELNLRRSYGWQGVDHPSSVAGSLIGPNGYGHTGFTGTSLYVDPDAGRWYVLLTNRVHPSRDAEGIGPIRRRAHNLLSRL
ncbi:serine hydrolase domain-containing protein [Microlunatus soli]|uniref:CubicO group peptidase, beta-lactamase class C family n=1 Tax=Microlunatus soli TaxID=630515 RepID=A0A1H1ZJX9_9ACTN|nr:serine hydrolase domain-containing protein [Microlunatus soli]SDT34028.1 CubicO group peptidase, beta-lactamase class C family [Microlunatus soli]